MASTRKPSTDAREAMGESAPLIPAARGAAGQLPSRHASLLVSVLCTGTASILYGPYRYKL